jgi:hypothetical protein
MRGTGTASFLGFADGNLIGLFTLNFSIRSATTHLFFPLANPTRRNASTRSRYETQGCSGQLQRSLRDFPIMIQPGEPQRPGGAHITVAAYGDVGAGV